MWFLYLDGLGLVCRYFFFFFQAEDGIRDIGVTGVQTCALPIFFTASPANTCGLFDFADQRHADTWFALYEHFERDGLDFWWFDWCCDESIVDAPGLTADAWINQLYAERSRARGERWPSLSRIGSSLQQYTSPQPGIWAEHRNAIHFTGDTFDRWEVLDFQTRFTAAE